jgi:hypothetical protein
MPDDFELEYSGKVFRCRQIVTGDKVLYQSIHVDGIGSKPDAAPYGGPQGHPVSSMASAARLIAWEIIGDQHKSRMQ